MAAQRMDDDARRAYWTKSMEAAVAFMTRAATHPVTECGEPMAPLAEAARRAKVEVRFSDTRIAGKHDRMFYLREGLIPEFVALARELNRRGWVLRVEDAYRTPTMQKHLCRTPRVFEQVVARCRWEKKGQTPDRELVLRRLSALTAICPKVGTHMSGSALDVSIWRGDTGAEIDRGAPYLEMSELTPMASPFVPEAARQNRQEITALMAHHGFVAYPAEFWHYSRGDAYDEMLSRTGRPARYGAVRLDPATGAVTPIEEPLAPLSTLDDIQHEMEQALKHL